jgi:hypothetical protein
VGGAVAGGGRGGDGVEQSGADGGAELTDAVITQIVDDVFLPLVQP